MSKKIIVGRFGSVSGVHGWIKVISFTQPEEKILEYSQHWLITKADQWEPVKVVDIRISGRFLLVKLMGFDTPEQSRVFTNSDIAIERENLPALEPQEYYWSDLEEMAVINTQGIKFGTVDHLLRTGANDVLVVRGDKERLIPYINDVIVNIDSEKRIITVDWEPDF